MTQYLEISEIRQLAADDALGRLAGAAEVTTDGSDATPAPGDDVNAAGTWCAILNTRLP